MASEAYAHFSVTCLRRQATGLALNPSVQDGLAFAQVPRRERGGEPVSSARTISRFVFMARLLGCGQLQGARQTGENYRRKRRRQIISSPPPFAVCEMDPRMLCLYSTTDLHPWARGKFPETLERPSK